MMWRAAVVEWIWRRAEEGTCRAGYGSQRRSNKVRSVGRGERRDGYGEERSAGSDGRGYYMTHVEIGLRMTGRVVGEVLCRRHCCREWERDVSWMLGL